MRTKMTVRNLVGNLVVAGIAFVGASLAGAAIAEARTPTQAAFHEAFVRMDARWPNISSHDYFVALTDAETTAQRLTPWERNSDVDVRRDLRVFQVYRNCWLALVSKERALNEQSIGLILLEQEHNPAAAREHLALAVAEWERAIRLWPYLVRERVRSTGNDGRTPIVATGAAWRAEAARLLEIAQPR